MTFKTKILALTTAAVMAMTGPALAEVFEVDMLNRGDEGAMVYEPAFIQAQPGDVIRFLPTDKGHNAETIKGAIPEGAETFKSAINEEFEYTVEETGLYGIKCTPHLGTGMVMLIQVGDDSHNIDDVKGVKLPRKARERMDNEIAKVEG